MNIESIFTPTVVRTQTSATLQEAAALMRERHVGALVVTGEGEDMERPVGIVTDRDLVIQAMAEGKSPREVTVGQVMTKALATVLRTASAHEALELMRSRCVRRLAVAEPNGSLAGILSIDDIVDALATNLSGVKGIVRHGLEREMAAVAADRATGAARIWQTGRETPPAGRSAP